MATVTYMKSALFRAFFICAVLCSNLALSAVLLKLRSPPAATSTSLPMAAFPGICAISTTDRYAAVVRENVRPHMGRAPGSEKKLDFLVFFRYLIQTFVRCKRTDSETLHDFRSTSLGRSNPNGFIRGAPSHISIQEKGHGNTESRAYCT